MPRYVIERHLPGAGALSAAEIRALSQRSNQILADMGGDVQWEHSYVTDDKIFCIYLAPDESKVREHARRGDFPADAVHPVVQVINPATAEGDRRAHPRSDDRSTVGTHDGNQRRESV